MAERFIIEIHDGIEPEDALNRIILVLCKGRISRTAGRKHHCHITTWKDGMGVVCIPNKRSERFIVGKTAPGGALSPASTPLGWLTFKRKEADRG